MSDVGLRIRGEDGEWHNVCEKREPVSFHISGSHQGVGECHREISHN